MTTKQWEKELNSRNKKNKEMKGKIAYFLAKEGYTKEELAKQLDMCLATLYKRLNAPDTFTLEEVRNLKLILKLNSEELLAII